MRYNSTMKTSVLAGIIIVVAIIGFWAYWYWVQLTPPTTVAGGPSTAMGLNGSPNQGNMGQPDNGQVQQPGADGQEDPVIGNNLALGTDGNPELGTYLIGYTGMTVYTKSTDTAASSTCYDACATNWPPYIVSPVDNINNLKLGVTGKTGTIVRADGQLQLTYNGKPLYFYAKDQTGSDTLGQGVGGVWFVAKP